MATPYPFRKCYTRFVRIHTQTQGTHTDAYGRAHGHETRDTIRNTNAHAQTRHADPKAICKTRMMQRVAREGTAHGSTRQRTRTRRTGRDHEHGRFAQRQQSTLDTAQRDTARDWQCSSTRLAARSWSTAAASIRSGIRRHDSYGYGYDSAYDLADTDTIHWVTHTIHWVTQPIHGTDPYDTYDTHGSAHDHGAGAQSQRRSAVSRAQPQHTAHSARAGQYAGSRSQHADQHRSAVSTRRQSQVTGMAQPVAAGGRHTTRGAGAGAGAGRSTYDTHHVALRLRYRGAWHGSAAQRSTALHAAATGTQYTSRAAAKGRSLYDSHGKRQNVSGLRKK